MSEIEIFDDENTISMSDEHRDLTLEFFPKTKEFKSTLSLKDDVYYRNQLYEYKISAEPIEVFVRLIERSDEPPPDKYAVKDGIVLESEIIKNSTMPDGRVMNMTKELIENLKKEVEWHKLELPGNYVEIFYIISKHPEIISKVDYKKLLRQTEQRIKSGLSKIEKSLKEKDNTGLQIIEGEYGKQIWYSNTKDLPEKERDKKFG